MPSIAFSDYPITRIYVGRKRCTTDRQNPYDRQSQSGDRYKPFNKFSSNEVAGGRFAGRFLKQPVGGTTLPTLDGQSVDERLESPVSTSAEKHANVFNPVGACITFRMWSFLPGRDYT